MHSSLFLSHFMYKYMNRISIQLTLFTQFFLKTFNNERRVGTVKHKSQT